MTPLLKKIVLMQATIDEVRANYVSKKDLNEIMLDYCKSPSFEDKLNINLRRGGYLKNNSMMDSGPEALPAYDYRDGCQLLDQTSDGGGSLPHKLHPTSTTPPQRSHERDEPAANKVPSVNDVACTSPQQLETTQAGRVVSTVDKCVHNNNNNITTTSRRKLSYAETASHGDGWTVPTKDAQWILVQNKRLRNRFITKRGNAVAESKENEKFKAAETKIPLFISNVHTDVCEQDIIDYIHNKTGETVSLVKIKMKNRKNYNAYKAYVMKCKLDIFLDEKLWPSGISFRRFVNFRQSANIDSGAVATINQNLNG